MFENQSQPKARMVWTVAALLHAVADAVAARFSVCVVQGEVSGFTRAASGHCYFSLKDADGGAALVRCAMFRRAAALLDFQPRDGQRVELRGRVAVYEPRGELQFVVESMQQAGAGALYEQFLRLKARLEAEGLFDPSRKVELPAFPQRVGVVTSPGAAALRDVLTSFARRAPHVEVVIYPSLVQGADAPDSLVQALGWAGRRNEVDVLLVCRGGGSLEDLWSFNDERVVRAIADSPLPVICGVGHETDVTLADFAADLRAPTPTAAAELATPTTASCLEMLTQWALGMQRRVHQALDLQAQRLDRAALRLARPAEAVRAHQHRLSLLAQRLGAATQRAVSAPAQRQHLQGQRVLRAMRDQLGQRRQRLDMLEAQLHSLAPQRVLQRGYAWLADERGHPLTRVEGLQAGDSVRAVLADGELSATVTQVRGAVPRNERGGSSGHST